MTIDPDDTGGIVYEQWTDGHCVGYKVTHPSGQVGYTYLCPSTNEDPAMADIFVYNGPEGEPGADEPEFYVVPFGTERYLDRRCDGCGADEGEECRPDCIGEAKYLESTVSRKDIVTLVNTVWSEIRTNAAHSDAHTLADLAADVAQRLQHDFPVPPDPPPSLAEMHAQIDAVRGKSVVERAQLGGHLNDCLQSFPPAPEVTQIRIRIYTELLGLDPVRAAEIFQ